MKFIESMLRRFASEEVKGLVDKLETDDAFRAEYFSRDDYAARKVTLARYILQPEVANRSYDNAAKDICLTPADLRFIKVAMRRIYKIHCYAKTKTTIMNVLLDNVEKPPSAMNAQAARQISGNGVAGTIPAHALAGMFSAAAQQGSSYPNYAIHQLAQKLGQF